MNSSHSSSPARWAGVGCSDAAGAHEAGFAAADQALHHDDAQLLVVFCSDSYDLTELLSGINERSGGVPLIGCSTAGQISAGGPVDASVVVTALGGDFAVSTSAAQVAGRVREAGVDVAEALVDATDKPHEIVMLLSDALAGDQQEIIRGAYGVLGAGVPLVGACAGDDMKMRATFQLHGDQVLEGGVVAASVGSDAPFGVGVRHGWCPIGEPMLVTRSGGNRVYELDDKPALDVYLDRWNAPEEVRDDPAAFADWGMTRPLGLVRRSNEYAARFVAGADFEERSLQMIAEVPQGGLAWLMEGSRESVEEATDQACDAALAALGDDAPVALFAFDCAARRGVLGDGIESEQERLAGRAGGKALAGFYSYGEIARTAGVAGFHNQTLVVLAVS
jgi:hypothetical protein